MIGIQIWWRIQSQTYSGQLGMGVNKMFDGMIMFTILFVSVLFMGYLIDKESKRIKKKNE
jgi:hypothetical protein